jgi:GNAT superfamily N-acetyltransferase
MECFINLTSALQKGEIKVIKLSESKVIKPFNCGIRDLNEFLFNDAKTYHKYLYSTTFLFENNEKTIAYYSLLNDVLNIDPHIDKEFEQEIFDIIANKDYSFLLGMKDAAMFPAAKIGRLAVDLEFQHCGWGSEILNLIVMSFLTDNKTGCQFLTVDALNNKDTLRFYERNGFSFITLADCNKPSRQMYKNLIAIKRIHDL